MKQIPNLFTLGNLYCGFLGIIHALMGDLYFASALIFLAGFLDLADGWLARYLDAYSPIGEQLDSLADLVSFGVLPGIILHVMLLDTQSNWLFSFYVGQIPLASLLPFLIPACGAIRLARFNTQAGDRKTFIGLPIPAVGLFVAAIPFMLRFDLFVWQSETYYLRNLILTDVFILGVTFFLSYAMLAKIPVFSTKNIQNPTVKKLFIALAVIFVVLAFTTFFVSIPVVILLYLLLSVLFQKQYAD